MSLLGHKLRAGLLACSALFATAMIAHGQTGAPASSCPPVRDAQGNLVTNANCAAGTPAVPAPQRFPYPGEAPAPAPATPSVTQPATPQPQQPTSQAPAGQRFPYPGESDTPATPQPVTPQTSPSTPGGTQSGAPNGPPLQDAGSSGQSSSSRSSSSSSSSSSSGSDDAGAGSKADDPDANDPAAVPRSKRHKLPPTPRQSPSEREQEDVQVAGFYFNDGNFKGSYDRAKDAVTLDDEDAAAHLALGNAARKLGKLDEAEKAYKRCLDLDPVPKVRRPAERALKEMTGGG